MSTRKHDIKVQYLYDKGALLLNSDRVSKKDQKDQYLHEIGWNEVLSGPWSINFTIQLRLSLGHQLLVFASTTNLVMTPLRRYLVNIQMQTITLKIYKRGRCTSIWQFCGLISVPWELSSQSLAGLALDLKLVMLRVHGLQIDLNAHSHIRTEWRSLTSLLLATHYYFSPQS